MSQGPTDPEIFVYEANLSVMSNTITVEASIGASAGVMFSTAYVRTPAGDVRTERRELGTHPRRGYPMYLREYAVVHALELAIEYGITDRASYPEATYTVVRAGDDLLCKRLSDWFATGAWRIQSAAGGEIANCMYRLARDLSMPLIFYGFPYDLKNDEVEGEHLDVGWTVLRATRMRAASLIQGEQSLSPTWGRIARVPLTKDEVQEAIKVRYEKDELWVIRAMGQRSTRSAEIVFAQLGLTRDVIRQALEELAAIRAHQVALCNVLCATRFKLYSAEGLLHAKVPEVWSGR